MPNNFPMDGRSRGDGKERVKRGTRRPEGGGEHQHVCMFEWSLTAPLDRSTRPAAGRPLVTLRAAPPPNKTKRGTCAARDREREPNPCMAGPMEPEGRDAAGKPLLVRVSGSGGGDCRGSAASSSIAVVVGSTAVAVAGSFEFGLSVNAAFICDPFPVSVHFFSQTLTFDFGALCRSATHRRLSWESCGISTSP
jgi:hypothetical protein